MTEATQNEIARRNYALTTDTFGLDNFLQICCGDEVLVTVCNPAGDTDFFAVFNDVALDDQDNDLGPEHAVKLFATGDETEAWRQAARFGYLHALGKMMIADQRIERGDLSLAA